jgi:hypothetical protein
VARRAERVVTPTTRLFCKCVEIEFGLPIDFYIFLMFFSFFLISHVQVTARDAGDAYKNSTLEANMQLCIAEAICL